MLRNVLALAAVVGCVHRPPRQAMPSFPTLQPSRPHRATAKTGAPVDPYADDAKVVTPADHKVGDDIFVTTEIGDPSTVESMVVKLETVIEPPSVPNHRVEIDPGGARRIAIKVGPGTTVTRLDRDAALKPTPAFDSDNPTLAAIAHEAVRGGMGPRERVDHLIEWITTHISYRLTNEVVASRVMGNGYGDCSEMALLFVAMARAVGIPAREVEGLAGTHDDGKSAFGFHAWAEVAIAGHWVQVDPTWNERVADASHIMLFEGVHELTAEEALGITMTVIEIHHSPGSSDPGRLVRDLPVYLQLKPR